MGAPQSESLWIGRLAVRRAGGLGVRLLSGVSRTQQVDLGVLQTQRGAPLGLVRLTRAEGRGCKPSLFQDVGRDPSCSPLLSSSFLSAGQGNVFQASAVRGAVSVVVARGLWLEAMHSFNYQHETQLRFPSVTANPLNIALRWQLHKVWRMITEHSVMPRNPLPFR